MSLRAFSSGVSGLRANQAALDVIGNNIANVNTVGFKGARTVFADLLSQTIAGAQAPSAPGGGRDPMQIGLGATLAAVQSMFSQGALNSTDSPTDLAIQGDGFFVLASGTQTTSFTRAGSFTLDANGTLVDSVTGFRVQGTTGDIVIAPGSSTAASATTGANFAGNLDASQADGTTYTATFSVNDSLGASHALTLTFTKNFAAAPGQWDWVTTSADPAISGLAGASGSIDFDSAGAISAGATASLDITYAASAGGATPQTVSLDFGSATNPAPMTGFAATSTAALSSQNGYASGALIGFVIAFDGSIQGTYDNGRTASIGQLQLASFSNPGGLERAGQNLWVETANSGPATIGMPGAGGRGTLVPGALEASNVDLAKEFTELITAQRGFEASAKIIRVGDEVLQTVVNIKQ